MSRSPEVRLDAPALERYAGEFRGLDGQQARIDLRDGQIHIVPASTNQPLPLHFLGSDTFEVAGTRWIIFTVDDENLITRFVMDGSAADAIRFVRVGG